MTLRRSAAAVLAHAALRTRAAVRLLTQGLNDADACVHDTVQAALKHIDSATAESGAEERTRRECAILREITELKQTLRPKD